MNIKIVLLLKINITKELSSQKVDKNQKRVNNASMYNSTVEPTVENIAFRLFLKVRKSIPCYAIKANTQGLQLQEARLSSSDHLFHSGMDQS